MTNAGNVECYWSVLRRNDHVDTSQLLASAVRVFVRTEMNPPFRCLHFRFTPECLTLFNLGRLAIDGEQ